MTEGKIMGRIIHKYNTEANQNCIDKLALKRGKLIIQGDISKFGVGDGVRTLPSLKLSNKSLEDLTKDLTMNWNTKKDESVHVQNRTHHTGKELRYLLNPTIITHDNTTSNVQDLLKTRLEKNLAKRKDYGYTLPDFGTKNGGFPKILKNERS